MVAGLSAVWAPDEEYEYFLRFRSQNRCAIDGQAIATQGFRDLLPINMLEKC